MWVELGPFLELLHHFLGIQRIKQHLVIHMVINIWIWLGVIQYNLTVSEGKDENIDDSSIFISNLSEKFQRLFLIVKEIQRVVIYKL
jgi:hypothetical protein